MAEFFGKLERLAADLYPYRWLIMAVAVIVAGLAVEYARRHGWHLYAWQRRVNFGVIGAPILALLLFIAWDLGSPLFINKTVVEEFPFANQAVVPAGVTMQDIDDAMAVMARVDSEMTEAMPAAMDASAGTTPVRVKAGEFSDQDRIHRGSGQAVVYRSPDGSQLLRLENLRVTNGPDLHVFLSPHDNPNEKDDVFAEGYFSPGPLKGNIGSQNYVIPDDVNVDNLHSVIIYCRPFHVIFSVAPLR